MYVTAELSILISGCEFLVDECDGDAKFLRNVGYLYEPHDVTSQKTPFFIMKRSCPSKSVMRCYRAIYKILTTTFDPSPIFSRNSVL
jgi:hypothetical protein